MNSGALLLLVWCHWFADFVMQTDWMAKGKSRFNGILALHVGVYSLCFVWCGPAFVVTTWLAHFCTDYVSSRISSRLFKAGKIHWFFVVVGFDQALHLTQLLLTYRWLCER